MKHHPGRKRIEASFSAKAARYDDHAAVQKAAARRISALIGGGEGRGAPWADLGCGTGMIHGLEAGRTRRSGPLVGVDLSPEMLARFRRTVDGGLPVRADVEALPLRDSCLGAAIMSLVLQWTSDPARAVREAARCLRPRGLLYFSALLEGTLGDLYDLARERGRAAPASFFGREEFLSLLGGAGLDVLSAEVGEEVQRFASARDALGSLSAVGATATGDRPMTRAEIRDFCGEYERRTRTAEGVPLRWILVTGHARKRD